MFLSEAEIKMLLKKTPKRIISTPHTAVTRRCLPALGTLKGGVVVVGNETSFDAGEGASVNASDVLEASK